MILLSCIHFVAAQTTTTLSTSTTTATTVAPTTTSAPAPTPASTSSETSTMSTAPTTIVPPSGCNALIGCLACSANTSCVWCARYRTSNASAAGICTAGGFTGADADFNKAVAEQCADYRFAECSVPFVWILYAGGAAAGLIVLCCTACICYCVCFRKNRSGGRARLFARDANETDSDRTPLVAKGETNASKRREEMRKKWGIGDNQSASNV